MQAAPENNTITLYELCNGLRRYIERRIQGKRLWVTAEIAQINAKNHAYLQLTETKDDVTIASMQAVIWARQLAVLREKLGGDAQNILKQGAKVLFQVTVEYHEVYGMKLIIHDVDPTYSLGELEKKKQETLQKLKELGLLELNAEHNIPTVPTRIGLAASPGTSGYEDFTQHLERNGYDYKFLVKTFPTSVQGEQAEVEIVAQLKEAATYDVDVIVLIRGGGSKFDLEVFNSFAIASCIAQLRLPVLTGIGHETDVTVADLVAHTRLKTPTAAAQFLIQRLINYEAGMIELSNRIVRESQRLLELKKIQTSEAAMNLKHSVSTTVSDNKNALEIMQWVLKTSPQKTLDLHRKELNRRTNAIRESGLQLISNEDKRLSIQGVQVNELASRVILSEQHKLAGLEKVVTLLQPENTLARGYSITTKDGLILGADAAPKEGDVLKTHTAKGVIESTVNTFDPNG